MRRHGEGHDLAGRRGSELLRLIVTRGHSVLGDRARALRMPRASSARTATAKCARSKSAVPAVPGLDAREGVGAAKEDERLLGAAFLADLGERVHACRSGPSRCELAVVDVEARLARDGELEHRRTALPAGVACRGRRGARAGPPAGRRRARGGKPPRARSASRRCPKWTGSKVPPKRPMGEAKLSSRTCPSPSTIHFCEVSPRARRGRARGACWWRCRSPRPGRTRSRRRSGSRRSP